MPRDVTHAMTQLQMLLELPYPFAWLYEVEVPKDPAERLRVTNHTQAVPFGQNSLGEELVYQPASVTNGGFASNIDGDLASIQVTVANQDLALRQTLEEHNGLKGQPAVVRLVNIATLDDPEAQIEFRAEVARSKVTAEGVAFELGRFTLTSRKFPGRRFIARHGDAQFGSTECGYVIPDSPTEEVGGGFSTCPRTLTACQERGDDEVARGLDRTHPRRYCGWPGIRSAR